MHELSRCRGDDLLASAPPALDQALARIAFVAPSTYSASSPALEVDDRDAELLEQRRALLGLDTVASMRLRILPVRR
jgi:hypothetical protein